MLRSSKPYEISKSKELWACSKSCIVSIRSRWQCLAQQFDSIINSVSRTLVPYVDGLVYLAFHHSFLFQIQNHLGKSIRKILLLSFTSWDIEYGSWQVLWVELGVVKLKWWKPTEKKIAARTGATAAPAVVEEQEESMLLRHLVQVRLVLQAWRFGTWICRAQRRTVTTTASRICPIRKWPTEHLFITLDMPSPIHWRTKYFWCRTITARWARPYDLPYPLTLSFWLQHFSFLPKK